MEVVNMKMQVGVEAEVAEVVEGQARQLLHLIAPQVLVQPT